MEKLGEKRKYDVDITSPQYENSLRFLIRCNFAKNEGRALTSLNFLGKEMYVTLLIHSSARVSYFLNPMITKLLDPFIFCPFSVRPPLYFREKKFHTLKKCPTHYLYFTYSLIIGQLGLRSIKYYL